MKNKFDYKKLVRLLSLLLLTLGLVLGIVLSSVKVNTNLVYGPEYKGTYRVSVQVSRDDNKKVNLNDASSSLQDKLSPFNDIPLIVNKKGKNHLELIASRSAFNNNTFNLRQQIESGGGMFVLSRDPSVTDDTSNYADFYTNSKVLEASGDNTVQRLRTNMIFNQKINSVSLSNGTGRSPYIDMSLQKVANSNDYVLQKIIQSALTPSQGTTIPQLFFVTDLEALINELRYFYTLGETDARFFRTYYDSIIRPAQDLYSTSSDDNLKAILRNLFGGTITYQNPGTTLVLTRPISLIDTTYDLANSRPIINGSTISGTKSYDDLKNILTIFTPFEDSASATSNLIYASDLTTGLGDEIETLNLGTNSNGSGAPTIHKQDAFNDTINFFMNKVLFTSKDASTQPALNDKLTSLYPPIKNSFVYHNYDQTLGGVIAGSDSYTTVNLVSSKMAFFTPGSNGNGSTTNKIAAGFYIPTSTLTVARRAVASIKQNTAGINYGVESIISQDAVISYLVWIISIAVLSLIALALMIFLLFVYRLMGLFTIIIATTTAALLLLIGGVGFHIVMGPQFICALFLIIGFVIDINLILFDSFSENFYEKKHGALTSFKISNKETWSIAIDALIATIIPSVVLFWVGNGEVKNFATLITIGVFLAILLALGLARIIYWLLMRNKVVLENVWLLPINTHIKIFKTAREQYLITYYEQYLEKMDKKNKYKSKELIAIKKANDRLVELHASVDAKNAEVVQKTVRHEEKLLKKLKKRLMRLYGWKNRIEHLFKNKHWQSFVATKFDHQIDDLDHVIELTQIEVEVDNQTLEKVDRQVAKVYKKTRWVSHLGIVFGVVILLIGVLAGIIGGSIGPNYASSYGKGQSFIVYGNGITEAYDRVISLGEWDNQAIITLADQLQTEDNQWRTQHPDADNATLNVHQAEIVQDFFYYVIDHELYTQITSQAVDINLKKNSIVVIPNYVIAETSTTTAAVEVNSNATSERSRSQFKKLLRFVAYGQWVDNNDGTSDEEIASYTLEPYSGKEQLRDLGIVLGIMLLALLVYMIIRFKWTYYVAMALGLVLTVGGVFAMIVVFRIPISIELLSGIAFLITCSLITMMLVLGKGKNILHAEAKDKIYHHFDQEVGETIKLRQYRYDQKQTLKQTKKALHDLKKQVKESRKKVEIDRDNFQDLINQLEVAKDNYALMKKTSRDDYQAFKTKTKAQINHYARRNFFFKNLYARLIDFSLWRYVTVGGFFVLTALALTITMPAIFNFGLIILIGLLMGGMVSLFIVIPIWVFFEKKRIRNAYASKQFVTSLKVSSEEQIVEGIND